VAELAAEEEVDAADEPDRSLTLDRVDRLAFQLADVGADLLAQPASAVGLDLRGRGRLEELVRPLDLVAGERQVDASLRDGRDSLGGDVLRPADVAIARPLKMSSVSSPATSSTSPTSVPSEA
jgi:hypothetical protein